MMDGELRSAISRTAMAGGALLCIGLLLVATLAQALDSCEFAPLRTSHHFCAERSAQSAPNICLICASAHAPSLAVPMTSVFAPVRISGICGVAGEAFHSTLQIFALHVRPPPLL